MCCQCATPPCRPSALWRELLDHAGRVQNDGGDGEGEEGEPERDEDPVGHCVVSVVRSGRPHYAFLRPAVKKPRLRLVGAPQV